MSYMNYEERLEVAKRLYELSNTEQKTALECIFPELRESEDERIKKLLVEAVTQVLQDQYCSNRGVSKEKVVAWLEKQETSYTKKDVDNAFVEGMAFAKNELEKQGEKKSSDEVLKIRQELYQSGYNDGYKHGCEDTKKQGEQKSVGEEIVEALRTEYEKGRADAFAQMQKEWSEEDEVKINRIVACLENLNVADNDILLKDVDWLKSLKERYFWKPKAWEIQILESVIEKGENPKNYSATLHSILEQLKKLKG